MNGGGSSGRKEKGRKEEGKKEEREERRVRKMGPTVFIDSRFK